MRRFLLLPPSILAMACLALAGPADAQLSKPRRDPFVKVQPPRVAPNPPPPARPLPSLAPPPRMALTGLPSQGDAAPACRAQCTKTRLYCLATEDDCTPAWNACLRVCLTSPNAPIAR